MKNKYSNRIKQEILQGQYLDNSKIATLCECNIKAAAEIRLQVEKYIKNTKNKVPMGRGRVSVSAFIAALDFQYEVDEIYRKAEIEIRLDREEAEFQARMVQLQNSKKDATKQSHFAIA